MSKYRVAISPYHMDPEYEIERSILEPDFELCPWEGSDPNSVADQIEEADAIMTWRVRLPESVVHRLTRCQIIVRFGVGFDIVDIEAARRKDIPVSNVPDYCTNEVADHTWALILSLRRGIVPFGDNLRSGNGGWSWGSAGSLRRLTNNTICIVGLGRIGTATALRAKSFGMRVVFYDPYVPDGIDRALGIERCASLSELASQADIVSFHTPLTEETIFLANDAFFDELKPGATLVNTSRGKVVDIDALERALKAGIVGFAGLDVLPTEPPEPPPSLLVSWRDNDDWIKGRLIVTPHAAFYSEESDRDMRIKASTTVLEVLNGQNPRNRVN